MTEDYQVGYGRPPKHTRFTKGRCANPKGRGARKDENVFEKVAYRKLLYGKLAYTANGRLVRTTRLALLIKKLVSEGLRGNMNSIMFLMKLYTLESKSPGTDHHVVFVCGGDRFK